jgi:hypothetical protein
MLTVIKREEADMTDVNMIVCWWEREGENWRHTLDKK